MRKLKLSGRMNRFGRKRGRTKRGLKWKNLVEFGGMNFYSNEIIYRQYIRIIMYFIKCFGRKLLRKRESDIFLKWYASYFYTSYFYHDFSRIFNIESIFTFQKKMKRKYIKYLQSINIPRIFFSFWSNFFVSIPGSNTKCGLILNRSCIFPPVALWCIACVETRSLCTKNFPYIIEYISAAQSY